MSGALAGVTVVEFARYLSGPFASMLLADLGAEVIKVESPKRGDPFRWGGGAYNPTFGSFNRNKKSVALDLRNPDDLKSAIELAGTADVVIENYRSGVLDGLGLGYEQLSATNPRLVYCSITGFGPVGPLKDHPGFDTIGQAISGLLAQQINLAAPTPPGAAFSDHLAGIFACYGILAALVSRGETGRGQKVETSLLEATLGFLGEAVTIYANTGRASTQMERAARSQVFTGVGSDDLPFVIHLSFPEHFWQRLLGVVEKPEWGTDPRFENRAARMRHYEVLQRLISATARKRTREEWLRRCVEADVPAAPINSIAEVADNPQLAALKMLVPMPHPTLGSVRLLRNPVRFSDTPTRLDSIAPELGTHTQEITGRDRAIDRT